MAKIWDKGFDANKRVEDFTVGNDRELDLRLAKHDIRGSMAHIKMLVKTGLLKAEEEEALQTELQNILAEVEKGNFHLDDDAEDIHSQIEAMLTARLGEMGKKIHAGRSRNDQVLVDIKLYLKEEILQIKEEVMDLFRLLQSLSENTKKCCCPATRMGRLPCPPRSDSGSAPTPKHWWMICIRWRLPGRWSIRIHWAPPPVMGAPFHWTER